MSHVGREGQGARQALAGGGRHRRRRRRRRFPLRGLRRSQSPTPGLAPGIEGAKQAFEIALAAFSDFRHVIEEQLVDGDKVITRVTGHGRHTGEFLGIAPTGKEVTMPGVAIHRIADGKLVEHWGQVDALGLLIQLGVVPPPGAGR